MSKTIKNLETQELKNVEIAEVKNNNKKNVKIIYKNEVLKPYHFPKAEVIIMASSYTEALKKFNSLTQK